MTTVDVLKGGKALLYAPWKWTQGDWARTESGAFADRDSTDADCYCMAGACLSAADSDPEAWAAWTALIVAVGTLPNLESKGLVDWNDDPARTHQEIIDVFNRAIEMESAK